VALNLSANSVAARERKLGWKIDHFDITRHRRHFLTHFDSKGYRSLWYLVTKPVLAKSSCVQ